VLTVFDAGRHRAQSAQAHARYDEQVATYRETVLTAYQEVEDNLAALHHLADEVAADKAASKSAESAANHSDKRYDAGVADYVEVTTTHTAALQEERDAISARVLQLNAAVALVRATGGGWTSEQVSKL
jgi:outer membrane protein TolC